MAISPTTKKVILDGERAPSYPGLLGDLCSLFSGDISSITGALASMSVIEEEI